MSTEEDSGVIDIKTGRHLSKAEVKFMLNAPEHPSIHAFIFGFAICALSFNIPWTWSQMASMIITLNPNNAANELFNPTFGLIFAIMILASGLLQIYYNVNLWRARRDYFRGNEK